MKRLVIISVLMLPMATGCASDEQWANPKTVTWHMMTDEDLQNQAAEYGFQRRLNGFARWRDVGSRQPLCEIYTRSPHSAADRATWETVWHELQHCRLGSYHAEP